MKCLTGIMLAAVLCAQSPSGPAPTPPMGWNSYDAFGGAVNEAEVRANADFLAKHLAPYGWKYVVVDFHWYYADPGVDSMLGEKGLAITMDGYGRPLPAVNRFPSAAGGAGLRPLADYVHSLGLKFGVHLMRGIPRAAVHKNLPILGSRNARARDIANTNSVCKWSSVMYGVDISKPGSQDYYDSIVALYRKWGVDYIKADDMSMGETMTGREYHAGEIEALRKAVDRAGGSMVLSLSPGPAPLEKGDHLARHAQAWRISEDIWDNWKQIAAQFARSRDWARYSRPNNWPDPDMLPVGRLKLKGFSESPRLSRLTPDEMRSMLTLWAISRAPLMIGGDLPSMDEATLRDLKNPDLITANQRGSNSRELYRKGPQIAWLSDMPERQGHYLALFNLGDKPADVQVRWKDLGLPAPNRVKDCWTGLDQPGHDLTFRLRPHAVSLFRLTVQ